MRRRVCLGLGLALLSFGVLALAAGWVSVVGTHGNSMAPRIAAGDLVLVAQSSSYEVGDVVAYTSADLQQIVLHRVTEVDDGRYTLRGDHNSFDDPEQPTADRLIGKELLHLPQGHTWLDRLTSPAALGVLAFWLVAAGGATTISRRRRKRPMAQHNAAPRRPISLGQLAPRVRTTAVVAAGITIVGLVLGMLSWTRPAGAAEGTASPAPATMTFSYSADVPPSPAYEGTVVTAPAPLFRKLVEVVTLSYRYSGTPGRISIAAELSAPNGWRSEVPLRQKTSRDGVTQTGAVDLRLDALQARADAAAAVIAIPAAQISVTVVARIESGIEHGFKPQLAFVLSPLTFELADGASSLEVVADSDSAAGATSAPTLSLAGQEIAVSTARTTSVGLVLGGLLALGAALVLGRVGRKDEHAVIQRQYAPLLLQVEPVPSPASRPVVDVVDFPTLARLAERYGLLILHWTRSDTATFIVQDDGITYRYRTPAAGARPDAEDDRTAGSEQTTGTPATTWS